MSETIEERPPGMTKPPSRSHSTAIFVIGGCVAFLVIAMLFLNKPDVRPLRQSVVGFNGLVSWLGTNNVPAEIVSGGYGRDVLGVGLRILPLFDSNLAQRLSPPISSHDEVMRDGEVDMLEKTIQAKIESLPTLLVLPKWRAGMRLSGRAHRNLSLPDPADLNGERPLGWNTSGWVAYTQQAFSEFRVSHGAGRGLSATLYYPQVLRGSRCAPIIGDRVEMILGECESDGFKYWLLSDPDLLNSHGLRLGENAEIAVRLLPKLAVGKTILVDYTNYVWRRSVRRTAPTREGLSGDRDLSRLFSYPFSLIWTGLGIALFLMFWRAMSRFGPAVAVEESMVGASKEASIVARARLLRLSGHEGDLLRAHLGDRLHTLVEMLLGRGWTDAVDPLEAVTSVIRRRDDVLARELRDAALVMRGLDATVSSDVAADVLHRFEITYRQVMHEFGRSLPTS